MLRTDDILKHLIEKLHLRVFPLHSVENGKCTCPKGDCGKGSGKHPFRNFGWKKKAVNDLPTILKAIKNKNFNLAVATGDVNPDNGKYLVVVDVDIPQHPIQETLPKTFSYKTGGGGSHYWYWSPVPVKNSVGGVATSVDIRGTSGYVIIPPSKHYSGGTYEFLNNGFEEPVADIPQFILDKIKTNLQDSQKKRTRTKKKKAEIEADKLLFHEWESKPIQEIKKNILEDGIKIPLGVRNHTIFRLLASHRAKGVATYEELIALGLFYQTHLENPESFDKKELHCSVISVMRYPVYNSSSENVNKNYCKWLEKHGIKSDLEVVEGVDGLFFSGLKPGKSRVTLALVAEARKTWYAAKGINDYAIYKPQLLADKLRNLGFVRTRTAKGNLWNVEINEKTLALVQQTCDSVSNRRANMTTNEEISKQTGTEDGDKEMTEEEGTSAMGPIGPDGNPLTLMEEREEIITTDRKYNPDDFKYNGMQQRSQDLMSAQLKLFEQLTPDQEIDYENGTLLFDEDRTRDFMDAIEKNDIVGIKNTMYRITSVDADALTGSPRGYNKYDRKYHFDTEEETISIYDLDNALSLGFGQILYRNDKPFGLDNEMTYKVRVKVYADSVGRTYVYKSGREVVKDSASEEKNDTATTGKESA